MRKYVISSSLRNLSICSIILLVSSVLAVAQHGKVIHAFGVVPGDGFLPRGGLIVDSSGNLYGSTQQGPASNGCCGTVYELSPPASQGGKWTETVLYAFTDGADGAAPHGNLVLDGQGNLFGTASAGGNSTCFTGCGTVFELSPPTVQGGSWTETTLYDFVGGSDGENPYAGLALDQGGNLVGTTASGGGIACGGSGCGTVFELSPPSLPGGEWTETILYSFTGGSDGSIPFSPVAIDEVGNVFGTTSQGGIANGCDTLGCGVVFELTPAGNGAWAETVIHEFGSVNGDGLVPESAALLLTRSGALVSTTPGGGAYGFGTVFGMQPPAIPGGNWGYSVLYSFGTTNDGLEPQSGVISDGGNALFGTTMEGGALSVGVVFQLTWTGKAWNETGRLTDGNYKVGGAHPIGGLLLQGGALYGTANGGGAGGGGTVFQITRLHPSGCAEGEISISDARFESRSGRPRYGRFVAAWARSSVGRAMPF